MEISEERHKLLAELADAIPGLMEVASEEAIRARDAVRVERDAARGASRDILRNAQRCYEQLERLGRGCRVCGSLKRRGNRMDNHWELVAAREWRGSMPVDFLCEGGSRWSLDVKMSICDSCLLSLVRACREIVIDTDDWRQMAQLFEFSRPQSRSAAVEVYWAAPPSRRDIVKIGSSVLAEKRWGDKLDLLLVEPGGEARERALHQRYDFWRLAPESPVLRGVPRDGRTEWFSNEGPVAHYLSVAGNLEAAA